MLHVMIPVCQRKHVLRKVIEGLNKHSVVFKDIRVYVYDNNSVIELERLGFYDYMLSEGLIDRVSFDTKSSIGSAWFPKTQLQVSWMSEMLFREQKKDHYLLLDSDILVAPGWDEIFLAALNFKSPKTLCLFKNRFEDLPLPNTGFTESERQFSFGFDAEPSTGGFRFMNFEMLHQYLSAFYELGISKFVERPEYDDIIFANNLRIKYPGLLFNMRIESQDPLMVHLGDPAVTYSLLEDVKQTEQREASISRLVEVEKSDLLFKDLTLEELLLKFKSTKGF